MLGAPAGLSNVAGSYIKAGPTGRLQRVPVLPENPYDGLGKLSYVPVTDFSNKVWCGMAGCRGGRGSGVSRERCLAARMGLEVVPRRISMENRRSA